MALEVHGPRAETNTKEKEDNSQPAAVGLQTHGRSTPHRAQCQAPSKQLDGAVGLALSFPEVTWKGTPGQAHGPQSHYLNTGQLVSSSQRPSPPWPSPAVPRVRTPADSQADPVPRVLVEEVPCPLKDSSTHSLHKS